MWIYLLSGVVLTCARYAAGDIMPQFVTAARCRARCLAEFLKGIDIEFDEACRRNQDCERCWSSCRLLFLSYEVWKPICKNKEICNKGCKTACKFRSKIPPVEANPSLWHFQDNVYTISDQNQEINIIWSRPVSNTNRRPGFLVYVLLMMDTDNERKGWRQLEQTPSTFFSVDPSEAPERPEFWLLAVGQNGTIADTKFTTESKLFDPDFDVIVGERSELKEAESNMNLSVQLVTANRTVKAVLRWQNPPISDDSYSYIINLFKNDCNLNELAPYCALPNSHTSTVRTYRKNQQPSYTTEDLLYNTIYSFRIEFDNYEHTMKDDWSGLAEVRTPFCNEVDSKFTTCLSMDSSVDEVSIPWLLNVTSLEYNPASKRVLARITWTAPFNQSLVRYKIKYESISAHNIQMKTSKVNTTWVLLELEPHNKYIISAEALYTTVAGTDTIFSSMELEINTTRVELMAQTAQPQIDARKNIRESRFFNGMIIGVVCVAGAIILAFIIVIIYKKRLSFRDIIITKTAVAKSNSYKSNVGCKVDYSNQLLMLSDEWELDAKQVKFSSPIGQGAFGKVVTGYYNDLRVAIKLVRDSAPLSYKEDLLAEINLMKRIGSHPNIVSMIGACTIVEPIALVMEYIPYGNLQNFLKKCRQEGDLHKRNGGPSEITYSMMDENGDTDSGVVTPADMLSFARQVAMAMEYLAEKKYVHRDLAARNVLIDCDKVVKVCDFGLSRDIYNDNQYQKLTSGKLPLKWMAIESLRDRIFTTQSDVWSFGILLWEIVTMGASPYPSIALADLYYVLSNGYRMDKPSNCSDELYHIMKLTWLDNPLDRPNFTELRLQLENLLTRDRNYLELENINVPLSTSETSSIPVSDESPSLLAAHALTVKLPCKEDSTVDVNIHERSTERLIHKRDQEDTCNLTNL